jgi:hypothetical protein
MPDLVDRALTLRLDAGRFRPAVAVLQSGDPVE